MDSSGATGGRVCVEWLHYMQAGGRTKDVGTRGGRELHQIGRPRLIRAGPDSQGGNERPPSVHIAASSRPSVFVRTFLSVISRTERVLSELGTGTPQSFKQCDNPSVALLTCATIHLSHCLPVRHCWKLSAVPTCRTSNLCSVLLC